MRPASRKDSLVSAETAAAVKNPPKGIGAMAGAMFLMATSTVSSLRAPMLVKERLYFCSRSRRPRPASIRPAANVRSQP